MPACCDRPDPVFLPNGHRWCRTCHRDLDAEVPVREEPRPETKTAPRRGKG